MADKPATKARDLVALLAGDFRGSPAGSKPGDGFTEYKLDMRPLRLWLPRLTPVLIFDGSSPAVLSRADAERMQDALRAYQAETNTKFTIGLTNGALPAGFAPSGPGEDFALLDGALVESIAKLTDPTRRMVALGTALRKQVGPLRLSPYSQNEPARGNRFFGREDVLHSIFEEGGTKSFSFVGPRRIGKTSLLSEIEERMRSRYGGPDKLRIASFMAQPYSFTWEVLADVVRAFNVAGLEREAYLLETRDSRLNNFPSFVRNLTAGGRRRVAVFIDEVDHIIAMDEKQNYECLHILRAAFTQENCALFIAGFRQASRALLDNRSPLFGFTDPQEIEVLHPDDAREMVRRPFQSMGLELRDEVVNAIVRQSVGHPQIIALFCERILRVVRQKDRLPTNDEVQTEIFTSPEFQRKVMDTFLLNTNQVEEFVSLLLIREARATPAVAEFTFGIDKVNALLEKSGVDLPLRDIMTVLSNLRLCSIITRLANGADQFRFSIPRLAHFFEHVNLDVYVDKLSREIRHLSADSLYSEDERRAADRFFHNAAGAA